ncbi:MAG TPA: tRNA1(Val) (adenine(37)-N6)-methyltransferase [Atopostipes sp.]|nr:tRNA1(Val) (adenine(37)-N6)-methyltransferase [Atopostipes sp.]
MLKENERIDQLMQYDLEIIQSPDVFSFSLDAVLLGDFAHIRKRDDLKILDLCAGNGAVALMLSQKTKSSIYAVEIQEELVDMAKRSIKLNHLEDQVQVIHKDLKEISKAHYDSVDIITCNPPYFPMAERGAVNPNEHLAIARHEIYLTLDELMAKISKLLKVNGKAYLVHRPDRFLELMDTMRKYEVTPKRVRFIHPTDEMNANMVLVEGIKRGKEAGFQMLPPLYVHDKSGAYRPEVRKILYGEK